MIKVCDAIMSAGKSSAAIAYMNDHPDDKFIYITPYLDEAERIKINCPELNFVEPSNQYRKYGYRKHLHTAALIREGANISTTHQAFKSYSPDMLDNIREKEYTLIVDENVDVLESASISIDDLEMAVVAGYVREDGGVYTRTDKPYHVGLYSDMFQLLESRELIGLENEDSDMLFYWTLPPNLLTSFKDVFILTYMFEGQSLHHLMHIYDIPYEMIGVGRRADGSYYFGEAPGYVPEYTQNLTDMVNILYDDRMNEIGNDYHALSKSWFERNGDGVEQLQRNLYNCFRNIWRDIPSEHRLWATFKTEKNHLKGKGYSNSYLVFNAKATNDYRNRFCLAYAANIFMNVGEKLFYQVHGIDVDEDTYALSVLIQWIWRSAIRDGSKIYLYIPSSRMRTLFADWVKKISEGGKDIGQRQMPNLPVR